MFGCENIFLKIQFEIRITIGIPIPNLKFKRPSIYSHTQRYKTLNDPMKHSALKTLNVPMKHCALTIIYPELLA